LNFLRYILFRLGIFPEPKDFGETHEEAVQRFNEQFREEVRTRDLRNQQEKSRRKP